jgi:hypothetical protein
LDLRQISVIRDNFSLGKAPPPKRCYFESAYVKEKTKKPEPGVIRFGLFCPTSDWQHWQSMSIDK